jgi:hypothetical protein
MLQGSILVAMLGHANLSAFLDRPEMHGCQELESSVCFIHETPLVGVSCRFGFLIACVLEDAVSPHAAAHTHGTSTFTREIAFSVGLLLVCILVDRAVLKEYPMRAVVLQNASSGQQKTPLIYITYFVAVSAKALASMLQGSILVTMLNHADLSTFLDRPKMH